MYTADDLEDAQRIVYAAMPPTPQYAWPLLAAEAGCEVWVKHENHTPIGAFKVRGGIVAMKRRKGDENFEIAEAPRPISVSQVSSV